MRLYAEVLEILERGDDYLRVFASYCRGHKIFSQRGMEYTFQKGEDVTFAGGVITKGNIDGIGVGTIWRIGEYHGNVTKWPDETYSVIGKIPSDEYFAKKEVEAARKSDEDRAERRLKIKIKKRAQLMDLIEAVKNKK